MTRLLASLVVAGGLALLLMREIVLGIRSGRVRYIDSRRTCSRAKSPILFWFLVALFSAFSTAGLYACLRALRQTNPVEGASGRRSDGVPRKVTTTVLATVGMILVVGILSARAVLGADSEPSTRVAILSSLSITLASPNTASFIAELQRLGYVEGRNLTIDFLSAEDKPARLPDLAQDLVRLKPDVILTIGTAESTVAAIKTTGTIPIVFVHAGDPVRAGLVASLGRPGGNVTGVTSLNANLDAKRLALITEIVPSARRVAVIVNPFDPESSSMADAVKSGARARHVQLDLVEIRDPARLGAAVRDVSKAGAGALLVLGSPPLFSLSPSLAKFAAQYHLPAISAWRAFPEAGGLASYGTSITEMFQRAAHLVDRIVRGAKPADLSVEQPRQFELVINLKTAKALGLTIPESVMLQADRVIR